MELKPEHEHAFTTGVEISLTNGALIVASHPPTDTGLVIVRHQADFSICGLFELINLLC